MSIKTEQSNSLQTASNTLQSVKAGLSKQLDKWNAEGQSDAQSRCAEQISKLESAMTELAQA